MNRTRFLLLVAALGITSGCAFTPQVVQIQPELDIAKSNIGGGAVVAVYVVDERDNKELGRRGTGAMKGAAITTEQDMATVFSDAIVAGLKDKGFEASAASSAAAPGHGALLRIDIRNIEYETSMGFWTGGVHVRGSMKGTASKSGESYDNFYQIDDEKRVVVVPGADSNAQMINATVSAVIQEMFNDVELFEFLKN
ncbi:MAG: YajG family lipoprotein [Gammaproteobacteria bacterium]|nr:YajG family lipoprotein [Gammaproteobacteria bacterium]